MESHAVCGSAGSIALSAPCSCARFHALAAAAAAHRAPQQLDGAERDGGRRGQEVLERRAQGAARVDLCGELALDGVCAQRAQSGAVYVRILAVQEVNQGLSGNKS
jgi:hypothetical protein